jgi:hypothetical protein
MTTTRTDYENLSPRTLVATKAASTDIKVRRAIAAELRRRGIWTY